MMTMTMTNEMM